MLKSLNPFSDVQLRKKRQNKKKDKNNGVVVYNLLGVKNAIKEVNMGMLRNEPMRRTL